MPQSRSCICAAHVHTHATILTCVHTLSAVQCRYPGHVLPLHNVYAGHVPPVRNVYPGHVPPVHVTSWTCTGCPETPCYVIQLKVCINAYVGYSHTLTWIKQWPLGTGNEWNCMRATVGGDLSSWCMTHYDISRAMHATNDHA